MNTTVPRPATNALKRVGRFTVAHELGRGSSGCVYLAHDPVVGRDVAIKTVNPRLFGAEKARAVHQLIDEAHVAGRLSHANIVTIYEASGEGGTAYIAMEYLQGRELSRMLDSGHRFEPHEAARIAWRIAEALDHAHGRGVIHRDLKPANIYMVGDQHPKLIDFGIARGPNRMAEDEAHPGQVVTLMAGGEQLLGTPNYMSPEQARGDTVDARTDLYSLGAVLFEMLTGQKPFQAASTDKLLQQIAYKAPRAPHELDATVPPALSHIVVKALSKRPDKRYDDAKQMALDIRRYLLKVRRSQHPERMPAEATMRPAEGNAASAMERRMLWAILLGCGVLLATGAALLT